MLNTLLHRTSAIGEEGVLRRSVPCLPALLAYSLEASSLLFSSCAGATRLIVLRGRLLQSRRTVFDPVGLGVSRSHSMASFRLFGYHIARRWNAIIGRRHVSTAGRYIPVLHLQVTLHSNSSLSEPLHCFPARPRLYIAPFHYSRSML